MKKLLTFCMILLFLFTICGCETEQRPYLDRECYGEAFRKENENLFPNPDCEHMIDEIKADGILPPEEAIFYHMSACKYENCDYEIHYEPHTLYLYEPNILRGFPQYAENGYLYHTPFIYCNDCSRVIEIRILCSKQDVNCGREGEVLVTEAECLQELDWNEVFQEYPYKIKFQEEIFIPSLIP